MSPFRQWNVVSRTTLAGRLRSRLRIERGEERVVPAVFDIADGDTAGFVAAITACNVNNQADTINLAVNGTYNFTTAADVPNESALPPSLQDNMNAANVVTIYGNGSTLTRSGTNRFRFMIIAGDGTPAVYVINDLNFTKGSPTLGGGAVVFAGGSATFNNCVFDGNSAQEGGAIGSFSSFDTSLALNNCEIKNSAATNLGGAIAVQGPAVLSFANTSIHDNTSAEDGPGIWVQGTDLAMTGCSVTNNIATGNLPVGGGIFIQGNLTFDNGDISNNTVFASGGGIFIQGNAKITNSSITGNNSTSPLSGGGGIFIQGDLILSNSTVDSNRAGGGGGIAMNPGTQSGIITNSTITDNAAFFDLAQGGGVFITSAAVVQISNTIVAGNFFESTTTAGEGTNIFGTIVSNGFNLIGTDDGVVISGSTTGNIVGTLANPIDPLLDVLNNYGGNSLSRPLLPGSPALDAGDPNFTPPPDFDQRGAGFPRLYGRLDIGAFEAPQVDVAIVKDDSLTTAVPGQGIIYTIIVSNLGPGPANGVNVRDILTGQFSGAVWQASFLNGATGDSSGTGSIDELVDLPVGGQVIYSLAATIDPSAVGTLTNTAEVRPPAGFADPVSGNNLATDSNVLTPVADAKVVKTGPSQVGPGQHVTYTIVVSNEGPSTAASMILTDLIPVGLINVSWTSIATGGASGNTPFGTGNIIDTLTVRPSSNVTYTISADVSPDAPGGGLINSAILTLPGTIIDPDPINNSSSTATNVIVGKQVIIVGADSGQLPQIRVYNPLSGSLRTSFFAYDTRFRGGVRVATADFNGDGVLDFVTAPGPGGGPHVRVFDGLTLNVLTEFFAYDPAFSGGVYVAAGDVTGDGVPEVITGAGPGGGPHVRAFNAFTHTLVPGPIGQFFAYGAGFLGGVRVAVGDTNHDGKGEIITGAGPGGGPHVIVWDGATRTQLMGFFAYSASFRGGVYVSAGDMNFDNAADIITGAGEGGGAHVAFFDGRNGLKFREFFAYPVNTGGVGSNSLWTSGVRVSVISDINNDGLSDLIVAPGPGRQGTVKIIDGALTTPIRQFSTFDPSFLGGIYVGSA